MDLLVISIKCVKNNSNSLHRPRTEDKETLSNTLRESSINYPDTKVKDHLKKENHRVTYLMKIDTKLLQILTN